MKGKAFFGIIVKQPEAVRCNMHRIANEINSDNGMQARVASRHVLEIHVFIPFLRKW